MQADKNIYASVIKISEQEFQKLAQEQKLAEEELLSLFAEKVNSLIKEDR